MLISIMKRRSTIDQFTASSRLGASKSQEASTNFTPWRQETHQQYASSQFINFLDSKLKHPDLANQDLAIQGSCSSIPDIESYTQNLMSPAEHKMDSVTVEDFSTRRQTTEKLRTKHRSSLLGMKKQTSTLDSYSNELSIPNTPQSKPKKRASKALELLVSPKNHDFLNRYNNSKLNSKFATLTEKRSEVDLIQSSSTPKSINKDRTLARFLKKRISTQSNEPDHFFDIQARNLETLGKLAAKHRNSLNENRPPTGTSENKVPRNITSKFTKNISVNKDDSSDESVSHDEISLSSSRNSDSDEIEGSKLKEYYQRKQKTPNIVRPSFKTTSNYERLQRKPEQTVTVGKIAWVDNKMKLDTSKQSRATTSPDNLNDAGQRLTTIERIKSLVSEGNSLLAVRGTSPVNFKPSDYSLVRTRVPSVAYPYPSKRDGDDNLKRHLSSDLETRNVSPTKNDSLILNSISLTNKIWSQHTDQYELSLSKIPLLQNLKKSLPSPKKIENAEKSKNKPVQLTLSSKTKTLRPHISRKSQIIELQNSGASSPKEFQPSPKTNSVNVSQFFYLNKEFKSPLANNSKNKMSLDISKSTISHFAVQTEEEPQKAPSKNSSKAMTQATLESFRATSKRKNIPRDLSNRRFKTEIVSPKTLFIDKRK